MWETINESEGFYILSISELKVHLYREGVDWYVSCVDAGLDKEYFATGDLSEVRAAWKQRLNELLALRIQKLENAVEILEHSEVHKK